MNGDTITTAMVLAAGLGKRMRPLTNKVPKPLIEVAGKTLLDRGLDLLVEAGVGKAVINVHHLPEQIIAHVRDRGGPAIEISDERNQLLDSAGGIIKALPMLGSGPFLILNADTFWVDDGQPNIERLRLAWNGSAMDILLMLARLDQATGHHGGGDFVIDQSGRLRRAKGEPDSLIYAGAAIVKPGIFAGARPEPRSLNFYFDEAIEAGRLFGLPMNGHWITVGTPDMIAPAEDAVLQMLEG